MILKDSYFPLQVSCNDRAADETLKKLRDFFIKIHEDTSRVGDVTDLTHAGSDGVIIAKKL